MPDNGHSPLRGHDGFPRAARFAASVTTPVVSGGGRPLRITPVHGRWTDWDDFVKRAPGSTFAHRGAWYHIVAEVFGHRCTYLVAEDEHGMWHGVLPLVHLRGLFGYYLISMPFLNDGGPLGDEETRQRLDEAAIDIARESKARVLELRTREQLGPPLSTSRRKVAVHLPLPSSVDELWAHTFKAKLRSQIRRPTKDGMTARVGAEEQNAFYEVFRRNMRDLGTPVLPQSFFQALARTFADDVVFATVYSTGGLPAASACCLRWGDELEITWASTVREFNRFSPNMLLYATVMEEAIRRGVRLFNFGRSTPGGPTHRFKQQWGGSDVPLPWANWWPSPPRGHDDAAGPLMRAAVAIWKRLPLAIANRVGPKLAGRLPW